MWLLLAPWTFIGGVQTHPDKHSAIGEKRRFPLVVAQHTVAMRLRL
jgi:hypothetical protein